MRSASRPARAVERLLGIGCPVRGERDSDQQESVVTVDVEVVGVEAQAAQSTLGDDLKPVAVACRAIRPTGDIVAPSAAVMDGGRF
jgi:hypothetical protein